MHSGYEHGNNLKSLKINKVFLSSKNNNYDSHQKLSYSRNNCQTQSKLNHSDQNSFKSSKSSRNRSYTPVKQFYDFSGVARKSNRKCSELGNSWSSNNLYGNLKRMMMYGQKTEIKNKKSKISHSNLRKY